MIHRPRRTFNLSNLIIRTQTNEEYIAHILALFKCGNMPAMKNIKASGGKTEDRSFDM